jgi:hypothetical protein
MKSKIALLLAGVVLGSVGTGLAATKLYWSQAHGPYSCEGDGSFVNCKRKYTGYAVYVMGQQLGISFGGRVILNCKPGYNPLRNCNDFR